MTKSFLLPTLNPAAGAVVRGSRIYICDSAEPSLYAYDEASGVISETVALRNVYASFAPDGDGYVALSGKRYIYYISKAFEEIGSVRLPFDANSVNMARNGLLSVACAEGVYLCERDGYTVSKSSDKPSVCEIHSSSAEAVAYFINEKVNISVSCPTAAFTFEVPAFLTLRSLTAYGADVYGLYCYNYKYNCLLPILRGGLDTTDKYKTVKDLLSLLRE